MNILRRRLDESPVERPFKQKVHALGAPRVNLDKALALAAELEDEEIIRKLAMRK